MQNNCMATLDRAHVSHRGLKCIMSVQNTPHRYPLLKTIRGHEKYGNKSMTLVASTVTADHISQKDSELTLTAIKIAINLAPHLVSHR